MMFSTISLLLALTTGTNAFPSFAGAFSRDAAVKSSIFEKLAAPPPGWVEDESAQIDKDGSMMKLRVHLVHQNMGDFHDLAMKVCLELTLNPIFE